MQTSTGIREYDIINVGVFHSDYNRFRQERSEGGRGGGKLKHTISVVPISINNESDTNKQAQKQKTPR